MKLVEPDFTLMTEDGHTQYKIFKGTLAAQVEAFDNRNGLGGKFTWLTAPEIRNLISENPGLKLQDKSFRTGTVAHYANFGDRIMLYLSNYNNIFLSDIFLSDRKDVDMIPFNSDGIRQLQKWAEGQHPFYTAIDLDDLVKKHNIRNSVLAGFTLSTKEYAKQMHDDPDVNALVSASFSPMGDCLDRTMHELRKKDPTVGITFLAPQYIRSNIHWGNGISCLTALYRRPETNFFAYHKDLDDEIYAIGARENPI
jgi:hypothetical protein